MNIKIIGSDSKNGRNLIKNIKKAEKEIEAHLTIETFLSSQKKRYGINNTPAMIINGDIVSENKVLSDREIKRLIKSYCNE